MSTVTVKCVICGHVASVPLTPLDFIQSLAEEELPFAPVGSGHEVALRHIERRAREALAAPRADHETYSTRSSETEKEREFFNQVSQLIYGWKQGCTPAEWSDFDETVLQQWQAWRAQVAEASKKVETCSCPGGILGVHAQCPIHGHRTTTSRDARRYAVISRCIAPKDLYDKLVRDGKSPGKWVDLPREQSIQQKIDELCDAAPQRSSVEPSPERCAACGHLDRYHFDDGNGNVVCRFLAGCVCVHRTESLPPEKAGEKP